MSTIMEIKENNKQNSRYFFNKQTMKFFNSKIESKLYADNTFITSERENLQTPRTYTIRIALDNGGEIGTIGKFQQFESLISAREYRKTEQYKNNLKKH
jgi:hypothetical protein